MDYFYSPTTPYEKESITPPDLLKEFSLDESPTPSPYNPSTPLDLEAVNEKLQAWKDYQDALENCLAVKDDEWKKPAEKSQPEKPAEQKKTAKCSCCEKRQVIKAKSEYEMCPPGMRSVWVRAPPDSLFFDLNIGVPYWALEPQYLRKMFVHEDTTAERIEELGGPPVNGEEYDFGGAVRRDAEVERMIRCERVGMSYEKRYGMEHVVFDRDVC